MKLAPFGQSAATEAPIDEALLPMMTRRCRWRMTAPWRQSHLTASACKLTNDSM
jgi:hypothetical protein